ncbi:hypothetical protein [Eisenibacter elegans]|uniref:hypothetical protein n=1 Tax=Eisenibacter elegans TaxID=997 RepID=UPI00047B8A74|nr:hypothetical protein [Eisenibacter elegans]
MPRQKWYEKINILKLRTKWLCEALDKLNIVYFRQSDMNVVTIQAAFIPPEIATKYNLVPQKHHDDNEWYKIVLMEHVEIEHLKDFIQALEAYQNINA